MDWLRNGSGDLTLDQIENLFISEFMGFKNSSEPGTAPFFATKLAELSMPMLIQYLSEQRIQRKDEPKQPTVAKASSLEEKAYAAAVKLSNALADALSLERKHANELNARHFMLLIYHVLLLCRHRNSDMPEAEKEDGLLKETQQRLRNADADYRRNNSRGRRSSGHRGWAW
jgi:hypothetical protein